MNMISSGLWVSKYPDRKNAGSGIGTADFLAGSPFHAEYPDVSGSISPLKLNSNRLAAVGPGITRHLAAGNSGGGSSCPHGQQQ
jgi:hypothetical protein